MFGRRKRKVRQAKRVVATPRRTTQQDALARRSVQRGQRLAQWHADNPADR